MDDAARNAMRRLCLLNGSSAAEEAATLLEPPIDAHGVHGALLEVATRAGGDVPLAERLVYHVALQTLLDTIPGGWEWLEAAEKGREA